MRIKDEGRGVDMITDTFCDLLSCCWSKKLVTAFSWGVSVSVDGAGPGDAHSVARIITDHARGGECGSNDTSLANV